MQYALTQKEIEDIEEECQFWEIEEFKHITELTNKIAECTDDEANDGTESWLEVVSFMECLEKKHE